MLWSCEAKGNKAREIGVGELRSPTPISIKKYPVLANRELI